MLAPRVLLPNMPAPATPEMPRTAKEANAFSAPLIRFYEQERLAPLKFESQEVESLLKLRAISCAMQEI